MSLAPRRRGRTQVRAQLITHAWEMIPIVSFEGFGDEDDESENELNLVQHHDDGYHPRNTKITNKTMRPKPLFTPI